MPLVLKHDEIPSFLHPSSPFSSFADIILQQIERLPTTSSVLIDTFEELERDIIDHMSQVCPEVIINPIGPLFMMAKTTSSDIKGDISDSANQCMDWLDSKEPSSIVYISFGTIVHLKQEQIDEIAHGLLNSGLSFLWVVRPPMEGLSLAPHVLPQELEDKGMIVEWCAQERVLAHPAVACFLSHCGWNSTVEALSSGVPIVCLPRWGDQVTNAVYLVDVFKAGVRLGRGEADEKIVSREVVAEKLLEATVGEKAVELRENARRWKKEAEATVGYGGSSDKNFGEFVDKLDKKQPVRCIINNAFVPWVCDVADELQIPSSVLWVQSCACLTAYYYNQNQLAKFPTKTEPEINVEVPFMPLVLKHDEIPSFLHPSCRYSIFADLFLQQIKRLPKTSSVLIDTFEELERDIIDHMSQLCPEVIINPIGPLFMMANTTSSDIKGDISDSANQCMEWLDSKEPSSIVYISFGTVVHVKQEQIDEIAHGLLNSGLSFLWVVRPPTEGLRSWKMNMAICTIDQLQNFDLKVKSKMIFYV
ncbi:hypothetical protein F2Q68_00030597 [Brassica cretica]|uniref:Glycosyltransferase n=1 Tax=Brassica cretica TaxID=69181 RepID=A0A8S9G7V8_BRACR|nr:hypothetical protein F2Q68_00030597 [Brassica cretica]